MAGTLQLKAPPLDINSRDLDIIRVAPASLCRVSRYNTGEPHFGRTGDCRFDDAQPEVSKRFGTCLHLCACGCGGETVTPQHPVNGWVLSGTDEIVTLRPSILNPNWWCPNTAHYYITDNRLEWLP